MKRTANGKQGFFDLEKRRPKREGEEKEEVKSGEGTSSYAFVNVGEHLRRVREEQGLSLRDISNVTMVSRVYIEAIEEERMRDLPEAVYTRGFIRAYAQALGLDPDEITKRFNLKVLKR